MNHPRVERPTPSNSPSKNQGAAALSNIEYQIVKDESKRDIKRSVEIILEQRVNQNELVSLAEQIKFSNSANFKRTFIGWRIKGDEDGAYWARTDFLPKLTVLFLGSTLEQYKELIDAEISVEGDIFGVWVSTWGYDYKMVGFTKDEKHFIQSTFIDGSSGIAEYTLKKVDGKEGLFSTPETEWEEHFLVNAQGDLEFWNDNGIFYTAKKIQ